MDDVDVTFPKCPLLYMARTPRKKVINNRLKVVFLMVLYDVSSLNLSTEKN